MSSRPSGPGRSLVHSLPPAHHFVRPHDRVARKSHTVCSDAGEMGPGGGRRGIYDSLCVTDALGLAPLEERWKQERGIREASKASVTSSRWECVFWPEPG